MTSSQPMKSVANVCRSISFFKMLSGAVYGAEANIFRPATIADMELSTPQCLLLALLHSLVTGDVTSSVVLADICHKVERLRSRHLRVWLLEDFLFPRTEIEDAMGLLVRLVGDGTLKLPSHVMAIMTALANEYRIPVVQLSTLSEDGRCDLAIQLETAVANNSPRDIFELASEGADVCGSTQSGDNLLHLAARAGSSASIAALGILNADLEVVNASNATPLEEAVRHNRASSIKALLMAGAKYDKRSGEGDTYLHIAAAGIHNEALEALLGGGGMNLNEKNRLGETPLVQAVKAGNVRGIELLLKKGADCSALSGVRLQDGDSIVHVVARSGNVEVLKLLKDSKIPTNIKNKNGLTPLHVACNPSVARMLLRMGVAVDTQDDAGCTPLMIAAKSSKVNIVSLLLLNGADYKIKDIVGRTALHYAAEGGCSGSVTSLLDAGAMMDDQDNKGETPALLAAVKNKPEVLQLLVESGADLVLRDRNGNGLIHREARSGHMEVVTALLDAGAAVDMKGKGLWTALHYAAAKGHTAVVTVLLDRGADPAAKSVRGRTPLMAASSRGHLAVVQLLVDRRAPVNDRTAVNRSTALHFAAAGGHTAVVTVLLDLGADPAAKTVRSRTPLLAASSRGDLAVVRLLVDRGAPVNDRHSNGLTALGWAIDWNRTAVADYLRSKGGVQ